jgi:hypothetical protein
MLSVTEEREMENTNDEPSNEPSIPDREESADKPTVASTPIVEVRNPIGHEAPKAALVPPGSPSASPPPHAVDDSAPPTAKGAEPAAPPAS